MQSEGWCASNPWEQTCKAVCRGPTRFTPDGHEGCAVECFDPLVVLAPPPAAPRSTMSSDGVRIVEVVAGVGLVLCILAVGAGSHVLWSKRSRGGGGSAGETSYDGSGLYRL